MKNRDANTVKKPIKLERNLTTFPAGLSSAPSLKRVVGGVKPSFGKSLAAIRV
jgi:hypothetical protein